MREWLSTLEQEVRYALRGLRRSPGFSAAVILTLGLGLGANAAMFGVIDRLMFRPVPSLRDPGRVHRVYLQTTSRGRVLTRDVFPYTRYRDLQAASSLFSQWAAITARPLAVGLGEAARERPVAGVSGSFFEFFAARPVLGRFFGSSEDRSPHGADVVVLSHALWQSEFGGRNVLGETLRIGNLGCTIIGVAPEGFVGIAEAEPPAAFIPITAFPRVVGENSGSGPFTDYNWDWTSVIVRRKPGVTERMASAELTRGFVQSRAAERVLRPGMTPDSLARPRAIAGALKPPAGPGAGLEAKTLLWVTGVALIVLLIACANVANLMFARVLRRRREIALRLALGVSRRRLLGQFFLESLLLAAAGCLAGLALAQWGGLALRRLLLPAGSSFDLATDWRTLAVAGAFALSAGALTAVGPALLAIRGDLTGALKAGPREGQHRSRTRSGLLIVQGALSVVLLVGAGLFVRSLDHVRELRLGYEPEKILMVDPNYRGLQLDSSAAVAFRRRLLEAAQMIAGVEYAARANNRPFSTSIADLQLPGIDSVQRFGRFNFQPATPDYFKVMGTRILHGRGFTAQDREGGPLVVVVSESMGRVLWPGRDPLGQCIQANFAWPPRVDPSRPCRLVVGIAEDAVQQSMTEDQRLTYYLPLDQVNPSWGNRMFLRVAGRNAPAAAERVRRALSRLMPGEGYVTVEPLERIVDRERRSWRLGATMFVSFGVLALLVAAVGLYGVITYNVAQRMHELGVRIALGAQNGDVVRLVVGQGVRFGAAGVMIGLGIALLGARWIQPLLFQQSARDPLIYAGVGALLLLVAAAASAVPARRATRADPNTTLRSE